MPTSAEQRRENGRKGGRPKGTVVTRLSEKRASQLYQEEKSPLDVMLSNMWHWWGQAESISQRAASFFAFVDSDEFKSQLASIPDDGQRMEKILEVTREAKKMLAQVVTFRDKAQSCARDAAPYCHPRYTNIQIDPALKLPGRIENFTLHIGIHGPVSAIIAPVADGTAATAAVQG